MTVITRCGCLEMVCTLACCCRAVVTCLAAAGHFAMINKIGNPVKRIVAGFAQVAGVDMTG